MPGHLAVVNAGGWGTALSVLLANAGHEVRLWCRRAALAEDIARTRENQVYLPGVPFRRRSGRARQSKKSFLAPAAVLLVPISRAMREVARLVAPHLGPGCRSCTPPRGWSSRR